MSDNIVARFKASHSAHGMQLAANQAGIMQRDETLAKLPDTPIPSPDEEASDIA